MKAFWSLPVAFITTLTACGGSDPPPSTNHAPTSSFTAPANGAAFTPVAFDASTSSDADNDTLTYAWDFGDGVHGGGSKIAHEFSSGNNFTVKLTVSDGKLESSKTQVITISSPPVPANTVTLSGLITDTLGAKLEGVKVEVVGGSSFGNTDVNGKVSLSSVGVDVPVTLKFSKVGYADQFKPLKLPANAVDKDAYFTAALMAREAAQTLNSSAGGTLTGKDAAKLELPANALVDSSGKAVTGSVNVSLTPVNVTDVNGVKGFPGSFTGVKPDGSSDLLVSFGTLEFALEQNGQRLNLASGKSASIEIPSYANISEDGSSLKVGDSVPLWSLNEQTGNWVQEGTGIMVASSGSPTGLALRAEVTHFSWWNIDHVPGPTNPTLDCIAASDIGIGPQDNFAAAQICNMIAEIDRGLQNSSQPVNARQNTSILPGFDASKTIPIPNTTSWRVPANLKLKLKAYALNGTWYGEQSYQGITNANDKVSIQMRPIGSNTGANSEAIGLGWNKNYVIHSSSQTDTFTFSIPAGESRKITIASQNISTLEGTVRVLNGTQVISSSGFNPSYNTVIQVDAPSNSDFTLEVKGIKNAPGGYNLKLEKTVLSGSEVISSLPFYKLVNASGLSSGVAYQYKFSAVAGDLVRAHFQVPNPDSGSIALLHNQQSIKPAQLTGQGGDVRFNAVLPETGEYMLEISDAPKYALTLQKPTHVNLESNITMNVTSAFAYPSFVFDGIKDTIISLGAAYSTPAAFAPKISSFSNPDGTTQPFDNSINAWVKTLPATGTYTVDLEPLASDPNLNTSLTFGVSSVNIPTPITANSSVAGTISTVGSRAFYSLDLQVGDVVRMVVKAPNIFSPAVWVRAPNANTSFYDFSSGVVGELSYVIPTAGKQFGGSLYMVTQSGTYTLEVMTSNINGTLAQQTGDYSFNVIKPTPINLALDTPTMGSTTPFQFNLYTLNIPQTGYVNLGALENISNFPSWIKAIVFDSTGKPLIGNLDQYGFIKQLPAGTYTVALDPYQNQSTYLNFNDVTTRAFTFAASALEPPTAMDFISNALKNGLIDQFNERDYFSFNATQNQHMTVTVTSLDGLEVTVTASPPFNGDFTVPAGGGCQVIVSTNSSNTCAFTPSSTGQYVVSIRNNQPQIQSTGHYSISISQP